MPAIFNVFSNFGRMCLIENLADSADSGGLHTGHTVQKKTAQVCTLCSHHKLLIMYGKAYQFKS